MPQISKIKLSDIKKAKRFDAEYFKPEYLEIERKVLQKKNKPIREIISIFTDYHANGSYRILNENVELLDKKDYALMVRTIDFETENFETDSKFLSKSSYDFLEKTKMFGGEIVINKIGNAGKVYFLQNLNRPVSLGMNQFMLRVNNEVNNYYLYIYLISKYGKKLLERRITGAVPLSIDKQSVKNVLVPLLPQSFQHQIETLVKQAHQKQTQTKENYEQAEQILLQELGLIDFEIKHRLTFATTKKEIEKAKRFDAEYFQPKYEEIIQKIENYQGGFCEIGNIVSWQKGFEVGSEEYQKKGFHFGRVSDFSINGFDNISKKISEKNYLALEKYFKPQKGEILFTKDGTIGLSYLLKEDFQGILSSAFLRLKLKQKFDGETLTLILNSILTKLQIEKFSGGAIINHLKPSDFQKIKIPLLAEKIQTQIKELIEQSHALRKQSKELLEKAKKMVEDEIEKK